MNAAVDSDETQLPFQTEEFQELIRRKTEKPLTPQANPPNINRLFGSENLLFGNKVGTLLKHIGKKFSTGELLIQGENLFVLSLLSKIPQIRGKVRLVYIDPPFGTRQSFTVTSDRIATISRGNGGIVAYHELSGRFSKKRGLSR